MGGKRAWQLLGAVAGLLLGVAAGALLGGFYAIFVILGLCIGLTVAYAFVGDRETTPEEDAAAAAAVAKCVGVGAIIASALGAAAPPAIATAIIIEHSRRPATGEEGWAWFGFFLVVVPVSALVALVGLGLGILASRQQNPLGRTAVRLASAGFGIAAAAAIFVLITNWVGARGGG